MRKINKLIIVLAIIGFVLLLNMSSIGDPYNTNQTKSFDTYENVIHGTNIYTDDTDGDGLTDYEEVKIYDSNPLVADTDGDGLDDGEEIKQGTDPTKVDTSGDGFPDSYSTPKVETGVEKFGKYDPTRLNIIVEVDTDTKTEFPDDEVFEVLRDNFNSAPVESESGKKGINIIFIKDNMYVDSPNKSIKNIDLDTYHNTEEHGTYYMYFTSEVKASNQDGNVSGIYIRDSDILVVEDVFGVKNQASIIQHEIGHKMGLLPSVYEGIDSTDIQFKNYQSVMNYNYNTKNRGTIGYSSSNSVFNDWEYIEEHIDENNDYQTPIKCTLPIQTQILSQHLYRESCSA